MVCVPWCKKNGLHGFVLTNAQSRLCSEAFNSVMGDQLESSSSVEAATGESHVLSLDGALGSGRSGILRKTEPTFLGASKLCCGAEGLLPSKSCSHLPKSPLIALPWRGGCSNKC